MKKIIQAIIILIATSLVFYLLSLKQENEGNTEIGDTVNSEELTSEEPTETVKQTEEEKQAKKESFLEVTFENLEKEILQESTGQKAEKGDKVTVDYEGFLEDGTKFDSSLDRGIPFSFIVGNGQVIKGWDTGVAGMKLGEKIRLYIPAEFAYGEKGSANGKIPANANLIFEIELLSIN